ncbi:UNVERIFIED_CONTAM: hypothetical protein NCL1_07604 [Trichonephila clavipes]
MYLVLFSLIFSPIRRASFSKDKKACLSAVGVRAMISMSSTKANNCIDLLKIFPQVLILESLTTFSNAKLRRTCTYIYFKLPFVLVFDNACYILYTFKDLRQDSKFSSIRRLLSLLLIMIMLEKDVEPNCERTANVSRNTIPSIENDHAFLLLVIQSRPLVL